MTPRRLTLVVPSLAYGGAEKTAVSMANHWAKQGCDVALVTLDSQAGDTFALSPDVRRTSLDLMRESGSPLHAIMNNLRRIARLRRAARDSRPDAVISFTDKMNIVTLIACAGLGVPVIITERTDPRHHAIGRAWDALRRLMYRRGAALVVQTEDVRRHMQPAMHGRPVFVIPNAVDRPHDPGRIAGLTNESGDRLVVGMGRLSAEKGFDLLIRAFAQVAADHPGWTLKILGEGPQRAELQGLIKECGLSERVSLAGWSKEPSAVLSRADLFVLPSRYEGFPNALLEAMACGLPAISFDCESGPAEIIRHETDGLLVPPGDVAALARAMDRLMLNPDERRQFGLRAVEVTDRFSTERYFRLWEDVLSAVLSR